MTDEEKRKRFEIVKQCYDELKEHPYWINFDRTLLRDVLSLFGKISRNYWGTADNTNPYYAVIRCVTHDFNCMLCSISDSIRLGRMDEGWEKHMGDVNMVLQVYLMNVHRMIENREPDGNVVGYTFSRSDGLSKFQAFKEEDGTYKVFCIIDTQEKYDKMKKYLEKRADKTKSRGAIQEWAAKSLQELDEGKDEIGTVWKITLNQK